MTIEPIHTRWQMLHRQVKIPVDVMGVLDNPALSVQDVYAINIGIKRDIDIQEIVCWIGVHANVWGDGCMSGVNVVNGYDDAPNEDDLSIRKRIKASCLCQGYPQLISFIVYGYLCCTIRAGNRIAVILNKLAIGVNLKSRETVNQMKGIRGAFQSTGENGTDGVLLFKWIRQVSGVYGDGLGNHCGRAADGQEKDEYRKQAGKRAKKSLLPEGRLYESHVRKKLKVTDDDQLTSDLSQDLSCFISMRRHLFHFFNGMMIFFAYYL